MTLYYCGMYKYDKCAWFVQNIPFKRSIQAFNLLQLAKKIDLILATQILVFLVSAAQY